MQSLGSKCDRREWGVWIPGKRTFHWCLQRQKELSPQKAHPISHYLKLYLPWIGFSCKTGFSIGTEDVTAQSTVLRHSKYCKLRDICWGLRVRKILLISYFLFPFSSGVSNKCFSYLRWVFETKTSTPTPKTSHKTHKGHTRFYHFSLEIYRATTIQQRRNNALHRSNEEFGYGLLKFSL